MAANTSQFSSPSWSHSQLFTLVGPSVACREEAAPHCVLTETVLPTEGQTLPLFCLVSLCCHGNPTFGAKIWEQHPWSLNMDLPSCHGSPTPGTTRLSSGSHFFLSVSILLSLLCLALTHSDLQVEGQFSVQSEQEFYIAKMLGQGNSWGLTLRGSGVSEAPGVQLL